MTKIYLAALIATGIAAGQHLTAEQKEVDFRYMVSLYNTSYAPLEWKKEFLGFDALNIRPWLDKVAATKTDLEFYDVCAEYVASLQDSHAFFALPSDFVARLGFTVDIFDRAVLIDSINRTMLPARDFPFVVGDEVVSVDGVDVQTLIDRYAKYSPQGNVSATRRLAAARIATRPQSRMPYAGEIGDTASVVIRRQNGDLETYRLDWAKTGTPLATGPVPSPKVPSAAKIRNTSAGIPNYMEALEEIRHSGVSGHDAQFGVLNYGARNPIFLAGMGSSFTRRLGGSNADFFYSGVFQHDGLRIGFLRIPTYAPQSQALALEQLDAEIAWFNANTDGLVIDQMRNTGGSLCFAEAVMSRLTRDKFQTTAFELRAFWWRAMTYYNSMINAKNAGAPPEVIEQYEKLYNAMLEANRQNRGVTRPIPICTSSQLRDPNMDAFSVPTGYTKPTIMLIDEFSTSSADSVPSMFQESRRGILYGMRSNGAGGNNISVDAGPYSEAVVGMTIGMQVKYTPVSLEGYPYTGRIENVGVHPDVVNDYMTRENLLGNGAPFVKQFLDGMAAYIRQQRR